MPTDPKVDATSQNVDPALQKDNIASRTPIGERPKSARDLLMEDMDRRIEEQRSSADEEAFQAGDARAIMMAAEMRAESDPNAKVDHNGRKILPPRDLETGQFVAEAGAEGEVQASATEAPARVQADPLEEFVVRTPGKAPMFKAMVNGQVTLIPLETARAQLQKHMAAEVRLREADRREKAVTIRERDVNARAAAPAPAVVLSDADLETDATELVRSLLTDPEAVAAKRLAKTLGKIRAATPQIDPKTLGRQAASIAKEEIAAENNQRALVTGLAEFKKTYPGIANDPKLFALADRETTAIAEENPDWTPEQVMMEAGKKTQEWLDSIGGKKPTPRANTGNVRTLEQRQQVKQNLTPMPQSRSATPVRATEADADDSPQGAVADIRKARGQAY